MNISIPGIPLPTRRARHSRRKGKTITYDPLSEEKETIRWQIRSKLSNFELIEGPIELEFKFFMPIPRSTPKKNLQLILDGKIKHTKKPDVDNVMKTYMDCMTGIVYIDDGQVYKVSACKMYSEYPRTEITIRWLED